MTTDKLFSEVPADKRAAWGDGPWCDEPDRVEFEAHGLPCLMQRAPMGNWCGYVAVLPGHIYHGKRFSDRVKIPPPWTERSYSLEKASIFGAFVEALGEAGQDGCTSMACLLQVHGGLSYAAACHGRICHVPKPGEPDDVWWFGFDCAHCDDHVPGIAALLARQPVIDLGGEYRDAAYVRAECIELARQLAEV